MTAIQTSGRTAGSKPRERWGVIPFKGRRDGKRRLASVLDDAERAALVAVMLEDVVKALLASPDLDRVVVISPEPPPGPARLFSEVTWMADPAFSHSDGCMPSLNDALAAAQRAAAQAGAARLLIVPSDLPLMSPSDIRALFEAADDLSDSGAPRAVIAPDGAETGTNALLLDPPDALTPAFGIDSFHTHVAWAAELGLAYAIVRRVGLLLDLDTPDDLTRFLLVGRTGQTSRLLNSYGMNLRLMESNRTVLRR